MERKLKDICNIWVDVETSIQKEEFFEEKAGNLKNDDWNIKILFSTPNIQF